jgi:glycosyltransferase involved in cell wall biosynthesis
MKKVSIVIPSYNEENYIDGVLTSIYTSDIKYPFEVIVADASTDNTRDIIKKHFPEVKIVKGGNVSEARNNGAKAAKGDYIIFIDADIRS